MPRLARLIVPEVAVHVVQRGHDRARCFLQESDYGAYLDALRRYAVQFDCKVHAYCLMTNHVHLLLTPHEPTSCAQLMKHVAQRYSKRLNARDGRTGTLWASLEQNVLEGIRKATRGGYSMGSPRRQRGRAHKMVTVTI